jgi:Ca2+-binding EF-hand superfamily protein
MFHSKEQFMKKGANFLAIVSCFTLGFSSAHADFPGQDGATAGQPGDKMFKEMDSDGDGAISRAEYDVFHANRFKEMDTNGDGKITRDEVKAERNKLLKNSRDRRFEAADANHDGVLTREETKKIPMLFRYFDEMDANHDGKVTREEMNIAMDYWRHKRQRMTHPG